jgi:heptosyltransferase-3
MKTVLERLPTGARIAVIRLRSLGDCVLTTPALHILKSARPDLRIAVVVEDAFAPLFQGNPDIERIVPPGTAELARLHPGLVLNLHGGTRSAQLTLACRSRLRAGFAHFRFSAIYNVRIPRAQEILSVERKVHTAEHLASAMFYLGAAVQEISRARLFITSESEPRTQPRASYAVLHALASAPDKTWPAANFRAVAESLKREAGLEPIFIGGPAESLAEFSGYRCISGAPLENIKSLLAGASLFVGNDSGPAHIAAAFGVRSIVLFGNSDHEVWAPWKTDAVVLKSAEIREIAVEQVTGALAGLLV